MCIHSPHPNVWHLLTSHKFSDILPTDHRLAPNDKPKCADSPLQYWKYYPSVISSAFLSELTEHIGCAGVYCAYPEEKFPLWGKWSISFHLVSHSIDQVGGIVIIMEFQESIDKEAKKRHLPKSCPWRTQKQPFHPAGDKGTDTPPDLQQLLELKKAHRLAAKHFTQFLLLLWHLAFLHQQTWKVTLDMNINHIQRWRHWRAACKVLHAKGCVRIHTYICGCPSGTSNSNGFSE